MSEDERLLGEMHASIEQIRITLRESTTRMERFHADNRATEGAINVTLQSIVERLAIIETRMLSFEASLRRQWMVLWGLISTAVATIATHFISH